MKTEIKDRGGKVTVFTDVIVAKISDDITPPPVPPPQPIATSIPLSNFITSVKLNFRVWQVSPAALVTQDFVQKFSDGYFIGYARGIIGSICLAWLKQVQFDFVDLPDDPHTVAIESRGVTGESGYTYVKIWVGKDTTLENFTEKFTGEAVQSMLSWIGYKIEYSIGMPHNQVAFHRDLTIQVDGKPYPAIRIEVGNPKLGGNT